jgi:hypothetical protein
MDDFERRQQEQALRVWAAKVHERAAAVHDRAAELHEQAATLHDQHAEEFFDRPDVVRRALRRADHERELEVRERTLAERQRQAARRR